MNEKKRKYTIKIISKKYQNYINFCQKFKYIVSYIIVQMLCKLNIVAKFS